jgi:hypothetical protein
MASFKGGHEDKEEAIPSKWMSTFPSALALTISGLDGSAKRGADKIKLRFPILY